MDFAKGGIVVGELRQCKRRGKIPQGLASRGRWNDPDAEKGEADVQRVLLLIVALIPGVSPFLLGHFLWGSVLIIVGLNAWNVLLIGTLWLGEEASLLQTTGGIGGVLASGISFLWTLLETSPERCRNQEHCADRALRVGLTAYLRGKLNRAHLAVDWGLKQSRRDPDLLFFAWRLAEEMGQEARARRLRGRLRRADLDGKWEWEMHTHGG